MCESSEPRLPTESRRVRREVASQLAKTQMNGPNGRGDGGAFGGDLLDNQAMPNLWRGDDRNLGNELDILLLLLPLLSRFLPR